MIANATGWFRETFLTHVAQNKLAVIADTPEAATVVVIFETWAEKNYAWWKKALADRFLADHIDKTYVVSHDDYSAGLMPGCYTSLTPARFDVNWHRSCAYPTVYSWHPTLESLRKSLRSTSTMKCVYTFRGNVASHHVRSRLQRAVQNDPSGRFTDITSAFRSHSETQVIEYVQEILDSDFVLCPRGHSPSTYRLYEAMQLGRCPVVIADDWIPPLGPDWSTCSITIPERQIYRIPEILMNQRHRSQELGAQARRVWEQWFDEGSKFVGFLTSIIDLQTQRRHRPPLLPKHLRRRLDSWTFSWNAGWTSVQRISRRCRGR